MCFLSCWAPWYELGWMVLVAVHGSVRKDFIVEEGLNAPSASIVRKFPETVGRISLGSALGRTGWPVVVGGHYYPHCHIPLC